jgi:NitT/TauT family transport system permease protein
VTTATLADDRVVDVADSDRKFRAASVRRVVMFPVAIIAAVLAWEGYKAIGPDEGGSVLGWRIIPRANDRAMPHVWSMLSRYNRPEVRGVNERTIFRAVVDGTFYSFRLALAGFALGVLVGLALAIVMSRFRIVERGLLPYLIISQTVPLIALAPILSSWGSRLKVGPFEWEPWMSAVALSAFLAFFPVAIGALRGLASAAPESLELMDSYAASWWQGLFKLRLPSSVPHVMPALKLAASAACVGTVVTEISVGIRPGIGRRVFDYAQESTGDPAKVYTAIFGAAVLGLAMALVVTMIDRLLSRNFPPEATS